MIQTMCPASCGELLQGWLMGGEKLISYSIDCYSYVMLTEGSPKNLNNTIRHRKARKMVKKVLQYYGATTVKYNSLHLEIQSEIPVGKGMASSTADLAATALATATYLGKTITQGEIATLCVEIEPTDSIVFSEITLFDHLKGSLRKSYGDLPHCQVLVLEGKGRVNTIDFRRIDKRQLLLKEAPQLKQSLKAFEVGMETKDIRQIGEAATLSALANQSILLKEGLEDMLELGLKLGAYGINVAHSGTVVGILHTEQEFDSEKFIWEIKSKPYYGQYNNIKRYKVVTGGAKIIK